MEAGNTVDAVLLAGGQSTRFGSDKAFAEWRGQPLYAFQLAKLARLAEAESSPVSPRLILSAHAGQSFPDVIDGVLRIDDREPGLGPLGALASVLARSEADFLLVLGVDLPLVEVSFLERLLAVGDESELQSKSKTGCGVAPRIDGRWEPLVALYPRREMIELVESALVRGQLRLQNLLDEARSRGWMRALDLSERERAAFANLNTPGDLAAVEQGRHDQATLLRRYRSGRGFAEAETDRLAREEPLEIRVNGSSVAVTMRTPGHDEELAAGFLFTEGLLTGAGDIAEIARCPDADPEGAGNVLDVRLRSEPDLSSLTRHVFTSSSCGVCGKATLEAVFQQHPPVPPRPDPSPEVLLGLPEKMRAAQETFDRTGGLHASGLFDSAGELLLLREDVGRHNALDKVIGHALLREIDLSEVLLLVSGRISFELMQKALAARIPAVAGISAPSSLAVDLARGSGQFLAGFLREGGFNVYGNGIN